MIIKNTYKYFGEIKKILDRISFENISKIVNVIHEAYIREGHIFIFGNGGSASTASHFACDLGKGVTFLNKDKNVKRFKVTSLTDNVATMTAWGNDTGYNQIFSEPLKGLICKNDVAIGISASGNSPNVINAIQLAKEHRAKTICLTAFGGGKLGLLADNSVIVDINRYDLAEDAHSIICHLITYHFQELLK